MGKGQKQLQQQATTQSQQQYQTGTQAQQALLAGSPEFNAYKTRVASRRAAIDTGTLAQAKDFISNSANVAAREQQRETKANLTKSGVAGLASNYADPNQIVLADKMNKDEFARDSAAQTEADANQYIGDTTAQEQDIINKEIGVDTSVMNTALGTSTSNLQLASQIAASRASILPSIIGSALGGASSIIAGGNWFQRGAGGGGGASGTAGKG